MRQLQQLFQIALANHDPVTTNVTDLTEIQHRVVKMIQRLLLRCEVFNDRKDTALIAQHDSDQPQLLCQTEEARTAAPAAPGRLELAAFVVPSPTLGGRRKSPLDRICSTARRGE